MAECLQDFWVFCLLPTIICCPTFCRHQQKEYILKRSLSKAHTKFWDCLYSVLYCKWYLKALFRFFLFCSSEVKPFQGKMTQIVNQILLFTSVRHSQETLLRKYNTETQIPIAVRGLSGSRRKEELFFCLSMHSQLQIVYCSIFITLSSRKRFISIKWVFSGCMWRRL